MAPPASKVIPGTGFLVDGFRHAGPSVRAYFLSHAHSDHYTGLSETWSQGSIYCSEVTGRLVVHMLGVNPKYIHALPMDIPRNVEGVEVILVDANHCPGAVQFLFRLPDGRRYVHCGDMRYCPEMLMHPHLKRCIGARALFLDTTYCNPKYTFPPQKESIDYVATQIAGLLKAEAEGGHKCAFLISTYGIGKERILLEVHRRCGVRISVTDRKYGVLQCLEWENESFSDIFTVCAEQTPVRVVRWNFLGDVWPFFKPNFVNMEAYRAEAGVDKVVGFVPTGWTYDSKRASFDVRRKGACEVHLVPYSEHSSYSELREFVRGMKPREVIPTVVNDKDTNGRKQAVLLRHFRNLVDETASKADFLESIRRSAVSAKSPQLTGFQTEAAEAGECAQDILPSSPRVAMESFSASGNQEGQNEADVAGIMGVASADAGGAGQREEQCVVSCHKDCVEDSRVGCAGCPGSGELEGYSEHLSGCKEQDEAGGKARLSTRGSEQCDHSMRCVQIVQQMPSSKDGLPAVPKLHSELAPETCSFQNVQPGICESLEATSAFASMSTDGQIAEKATVHTCIPAAKREVKDSISLQSGADSLRASLGVGNPSTGNKGMESGGIERAGLKEAVGKVLAVLSNQVSEQEATQLLQSACGQVEVAVNMFYDGNRSWRSPSCVESASTREARSRKSRISAAGVAVARKQGTPGKGNSQRSIKSFFLKSGSELSSQVNAGSGCLPQGEHIGRPLAGVQESAGGRDGGVSVNPHNSKQEGLSFSFLGPLVDSHDICQGTSDKNCNLFKSVGPQDQLSDSTVPLSIGSDDEDGRACKRPRIQPRPGAESMSILGRNDGPANDGISEIWTSEHEIAPVPPGTALGEGHISDDFAGHNAPVVHELEGKDAQNAMEYCHGSRALQGTPSAVQDAVLKPLENYDPVADACWHKGDPPPYLHIARTFHALDSTTKRLKIGDALTNMFRSVLALSPEHLLPTVYLTVGKVAPDHVGGELNVGGSTVAATITEATGVSRSRMSELYKQLGDFGDVAQVCRRNQSTLVQPPPLTVPGVFATLQQIASEKGQGAMRRRQRLVLWLLRACREWETTYLVRTLIQNLRVGASWRSAVEALGRASVIHREGRVVPKAQQEAASSAVASAYHMCPSFDALVPVLVEGGFEEVQRRCTLLPGVPVKPMLAKISGGLEDAVGQLRGAPFLAEYKYDGQRAQVHLLADGSVSIFSRRCEDKTAAFPDVAAAVRRAASASTLILDAEIVAVDRQHGNRLRPFQELSRRARADVSADGVAVDVCLFVFDVLQLDGDALVKAPLRARRRALRRALAFTPGEVEMAVSIEISDGEHAKDGAPGGEGTPLRGGEGVDGARASAIAGGRRDPGGCGGGDGAPGVKGLTAPGAREKGPVSVSTEPTDLARGEAGLTASMDVGGDHTGLDAQAGEVNRESDGPTVDRQGARGQRGDGSPSTTRRNDVPVSVPTGTTASWDRMEQTDGRQAAERCVVSRVADFLMQALSTGAEGLMLKALDDAGYEPSRRSEQWLKVKRDYCEGLADSFDLVPIGAWHGSGRKHAWFSPFLMAVYCPVAEEYQSLCRVMSGFSDAFYTEATRRLTGTIAPRRKAYYNTGESPSVWFEPTEVWEVRGADLTLSPVHRAAAGLVAGDRGVGLRFPRFVGVRADKGATDATCPEEVAEAFRRQAKAPAGGAAPAAAGRAWAGSEGNSE
eukprot:evm.model.scf_1474EXC.2 EVM.evm.TU.scf_1474EXC.2   scf_1474EXC:16266-31624(-)